MLGAKTIFEKPWFGAEFRSRSNQHGGGGEGTCPYQSSTERF